MSAGPPRWLALIALATIVVYTPAISAPFIWDDAEAITENPTITRLWPPTTALRPPSNTAVGGRPVVNLSFAVNHAINRALDVDQRPDPDGPYETVGYHLVNVGLRGGAANPAAGDAVIDQLLPEMLLYEKRPDGKMHLVGVEYLVFTAAWERVHGAGAAPPTVFGEPLPPSLHTFPGNPSPIPHYELHVWIWWSNPLGMFYPWSPTVSC